uniref:Uncharacterized protein n=1 Tax=viral metagenome TaxID=1070528 RepID=A0A6M3IG04_9ZZZZ
MEDGVRVAELHTPKGIIEVNDQMSEKELAKFGVNDRSMLFPDERDAKAEIDDLKSRVEKLESIKQVI